MIHIGNVCLKFPNNKSRTNDNTNAKRESHLTWKTIHHFIDSYSNETCKKIILKIPKKKQMIQIRTWIEAERAAHPRWFKEQEVCVWTTRGEQQKQERSVPDPGG